MKDDTRAMAQAWLPVLPGVAALVLLAWGYRLFHTTDIEIFSIFRQALSICSAGYLFTLAGFTFFGRRSFPLDGHARVAASLAVGLGLVFLSYSGSDWLPAPLAMGASPGNGSDSLNPVNAIAAVLAVVLAVVTLIAQKSASDARMEAEKARADILGALDIRLLAESTRLLALAQDASAMVRDLFDEANSIARQDEPLAKCLTATALVLSRLHKFLSTLHLWSQEPDVASAQEVADTVYMFSLDLAVMERLSSGVGGLDDLHRALRRQFWHPLARTLEKLLASLKCHVSDKDATTSDLLARLRDLRGRLNTL